MDRKFVFLVLVFIFVFGAFVTTVILDRTQLIRAAAPKPPTQFLIFSVPLTTNVGGTCEISIVSNDDENHGVAESTICPQTNFGTVSPACDKTDASGIATFKLTSNSAGTAEVTAVVNNTISIGKSVTCQFN